jgi:hypothetical protein
MTETEPSKNPARSKQVARQRQGTPILYVWVEANRLCRNTFQKDIKQKLRVAM